MGTFVSIKTMADGTPRMTLDLDCKLADIAALGMIPGTPFGIARVSGESTVRSGTESRIDASGPADSAHKTPTERSGQLCILACNFCKDKAFHNWVGAMTGEKLVDVTDDFAKQYILDVCGIESRKELDTDQEAASIFHRAIRVPFVEYRNRLNGAQ